jgi:HPt (histidine-containing phosphotransfer) domain-containing protein
VRSQAHRLKGAVASIGGEALFKVALAIEQAARADDLMTARSHLAELEKQFELLCEAIYREM